MDYYIYLKNTNEYIKETIDDKIWTRCEDINYAFNDSDYKRVNNIAQFICNDKHLRYEDLSIIGEEVVIQTTEYPVGNLKPLYYYKGLLSDDLDAKATLKNYEIEEVAIKALQAGCDYLLLADMNDQIIRVAEAIQQAVLDNEIKYSQLKSSADKVRNVAIKYT